ncbi:MAG TPA: ribosome biogenesis GTP-binding protein YihA/YsxC [Kofleriaceae bacterium]|nr:ribosome biogenesis GTP-binding protein YihA/YsxC [Kofleriaceae bacterium]
MKPKSATFVISASEPSQFPPPSLPEVAFAGRSNVGKSSLINALTGHGSLARTSRTPGRTRLVNWFEVDCRGMGGPAAKLGKIHFVDLPGYGYADVPIAMRAAWQPLIEAFLGERSSLRAVVLLIDIRRGVEDEELDFVPWLVEKQVPVVVALTKADKLPKAQRLPAAQAAKKALGLKRDPILFSAQDDFGREELWRAIASAAAAAEKKPA